MAQRLPPFYTRLRFATALIATWLLNLNLFGFSLKSICSPGFNCHGCPWATFACPIGALTYGSAIHSIPVLALGSVLAVGVVLGRLACAFLCPFGLLQDLLFRIPSPKIKLPSWFRYGKYAALVLLVFVLPWLLGFDQTGFLQIDQPIVNQADAGQLDVQVTATNLGMEPVRGVELLLAYRGSGAGGGGKETYRTTRRFAEVVVEPGQRVTLPNFLIPNMLTDNELLVESPQSTLNQSPRYLLYFCKLCPSGTLTATLPLTLMNGSKSFYTLASGLWLRLAILVAFLGLMVISSRPFCRLFCPMGALYALTARLAVTRLKVEATACIDCGQCDKVCPMDLDVRKEIGGAECIACGDCKKACPQSGIKRVVGF